MMLESSSKNLVADIIDQQGKEIIKQDFNFTNRYNDVAYSRFIPETLTFNDNSSVVTWFYNDEILV